MDGCDVENVRYNEAHFEDFAKKFSLLIHTQNLISKNIRQILLVNKRAQVLSQSRYEILSSMNGPRK